MQKINQEEIDEQWEQIAKYAKGKLKPWLWLILVLMAIELFFMRGAQLHMAPQSSPSIQSQAFDHSFVFDVPKILWIADTSTDNSYLMSLISPNNRAFAAQSAFETKVVNLNTFRDYLQRSRVERVEMFIALIERNTQGKGLKRLSEIVNTFILLNILDEHGGVMTDGKNIIVENFNWLRNITKNPYVNRGNRGVKPQIVGFYSIDVTADKKKVNLKPFKGMHQVDRYVNLFPAMEDYFMAALPGTVFMAEMIMAMEYYFSRDNSVSIWNFGLYKQWGYFNKVSQMVIEKKQIEIDSTNHHPERQLAIDHYGLNLINCNYGPLKHRYIFHRVYQRLIQNFAIYTVDQYQGHFGPLRYIIRMSPFQQINDFLEQVRDRKKNPIWNRSVFQAFLYPKGGLPFIKENKEKPFVNETNEQWLSLPKIIWLFYDAGVEQAPITYQITVENLKRIAAKSGWEVRQVSLANGHQYLDEETLKKINYTMDNFRLIKYKTTLSDLYRLAIISKHGGLYLDATWVLLQDLNWLINIGRQPSQYIYNRFGHLPKCVLYWGIQQGSPINWQIDEKHNTKNIWHLSYESSFIAAEKGNQFVTEWFELLMDLYVTPYDDVLKIFKEECNITSHQWINPSFQYLMVMDAAKCVAGRRQLMLERQGSGYYASASDYYKLWSFNGNIGQQKIRQQVNLQKPYTNDPLFAYRYSQEYVEGLIGKIHHAFKFFREQTKQMNKLIARHLDQNFLSEVHPDSIFMRHIWNQDYHLILKGKHPYLSIPS